MFSIVNSRVINNVFALGVLQVGNYLLPLLLFPYLARTLGLPLFGDWVFAVSFVVVFRTVVNYGFDLTATRAVSLNRTDPAFLSELYASVVLIRLGLYLACCAILLLISLAFASVAQALTLAMLSMLVLIGEALFPVWLFQGMECMSLITKVRLASRAAFVGSVFLLVNSPGDVLLIPLLEGAASLIAGLTALTLASIRFGLVRRLPSGRFILAQARSGAPVFLSFLAVHFYSTINVVLLGIMLGPVAVAQYAIGEKARSAIRGMLGAVAQAVYPALSRAYGEDVAYFRRSARNLALAFVGCLAALGALLFVLGEWFVLLMLGTEDPVALTALRILAVSLCFSVGTFLSPLLVIQEKGPRMLGITLATTLVNLVIIVPMITTYGVPGAAAAFLVTQLFQAALQVAANAALLGDWRSGPEDAPRSVHCLSQHQAR